MKKTFPLAVADLPLPRVVERIKSDVRKYVKRERRKKLPSESDFWDFDCRVGPTGETAKVVHIAEINAQIDYVVEEAVDSVFIEILAKPGKRIRREPSRPPSPEPEQDGN